MFGTIAGADSLRVATFHSGLWRKGPGLLLRDILRREDQVDAAAEVIRRNAPDILLLTSFDHDYNLVAAKAFRDLLNEKGLHYPHLFANQPNSGQPTGLDLDGDGRLAEPEDAKGYGAFIGQGGMVILSRLPLIVDQAQNFSHILWKDFPRHQIPQEMSKTVRATLPLSSVGHWAVPVETEAGHLVLLAFHAQTPVFDGPEDRNGRRNADEIRFWQLYLTGAFGPAPQGRFVLLGDANLDPDDGEGRKSAIRALLADPRFQDPRPSSPGARLAGSGHALEQNTVDWPDPTPGNLRVDYVLPSADLKVVGSGVDWPAPDDASLKVAENASAHRLVWVDLDMGGS